jgi:hypothetical protein
MRLLNDGDRYNQIFFAAAQPALASRWLQQRFVRPVVVSPPVRPLGELKDWMRRRRVAGDTKI